MTHDSNEQWGNMVAGRFFEDLRAGDTTTTGGRTVTEADLMTFIGLAGIYEELYTNVEYATTATIFNARFVPGLLSLSFSEGLALHTGWFEGTGMALLQVTTRFINPVLLGDTIYVDIEVVSKRPTSHPERGIVTLRHLVWKCGDGERTTVLEVDKVRMVRRRTTRSESATG